MNCINAITTSADSNKRPFGMSTQVDFDSPRLADRGRQHNKPSHWSPFSGIIHGLCKLRTDWLEGNFTLLALVINFRHRPRGAVRAYFPTIVGKFSQLSLRRFVFAAHCQSHLSFYFFGSDGLSSI